MCPGRDHDHDHDHASTSRGEGKGKGQPRSTKKEKEKDRGEDGVEVPPPEWESIPLPPAHVLGHLTDAHCHPTDLVHHSSVYDAVSLGGLASMATIVDDQDRVRALSEERAWVRSDHAGTGGGHEHGHEVGDVVGEKSKGKDGRGVGVVACFGFHPWFTHLYTLSAPDQTPSKEEHYCSLFSPSEAHRGLLLSLLPYLPEPIPFGPLLAKLKDDISRSLAERRLTMLGEVGLDGSARMRWPREAKHLHPEHKGAVEPGPGPQRRGSGDEATKAQTEDEDGKKGQSDGSTSGVDKGEGENDEEEWKRLTPFKVPMSHQRAILDKQMDLAVELGVNISFHSVACAGPSLDALVSMRKRHGARFTNRVNVDVHSAGGWSAPFWAQAEKNLLNLYASPSIFITGRSPHASRLIASISRDRMLVESDSHDVRFSDRLVWAAAVWVGRCKGWKVEGLDVDVDTEGTEADTGIEAIAVEEDEGHPQRREDRRGGTSGPDESKSDRRGRPSQVVPWTLAEELTKETDEVDDKGNPMELKEHEVWTVRTLERNWARFMRLIDD